MPGWELSQLAIEESWHVRFKFDLVCQRALYER